MPDELDDSNGIVTDFSGDGDLDNLFDPGPSEELGVNDMARGTESDATPSPAQGAPVDTPAQLQAGGAPQTPPVAQPAPQTTPPVQAQQPQPGAQPAAPAPSQPQSFEDYVAQNHDKIVGELANGPFKLTDAERTAMGEAAPVVASYMARAHLYTMVATAKSLQQALPDAVGNLVATTRRSADLEQEFFGSYPELKTVDKNSLAQLGMTLARNNPNITKDQLFPLLARTAAAMFNLQLKPQPGRPQPYAPANANGGANPHPTPRTPVQQGGGDQLAGINALLKFS